MEDNQKPKGIFTLKVIKDDKVIEKYEHENLIVATGRSQVAAMLGGATTDKFITTVSLGTNDAAPASSDTAITGSYDLTPIVSYPGVGEVQFDWVLTIAEANGMNIAEFGLICDDGTLFARKTRATIAKDSTIRLEGSWKVIF